MSRWLRFSHKFLSRTNLSINSFLSDGQIPHIPAQRWAKRSIFQGFFSQQEWRVRWGDTQQSIAVRMIVNGTEFFPGFKLLRSGRSGRLQQVEIYPTPRQHNKRKCWWIEGVAASSWSVFHLSGGGFKFYFKISLKTFLCTAPPFLKKKSLKHANDVRFLQKKLFRFFFVHFRCRCGAKHVISKWTSWIIFFKGIKIGAIHSCFSERQQRI